MIRGWTRKMITLLVVLLTGLGGSAMAKDSYDIAVVRWKPGDIYFNGVQLGQEIERKRIEEQAGVKINFNVFGANKVGPQRNFLDSQLAKGVDGVLLTPWQGAAMRASAAQMRRDGVPFVVTNAIVPKTKQVFVAFNNVQAGRNAGRAIVDRLDKLRGSDWASKGGVIIELRGNTTVSFDQQRDQGYRAVLEPIVKKHDNLELVVQEAGYSGGDARKAVTDIISRYGPKQIRAIASVDGTMAVGGAVPALQAAGLLHPRDNPKHVPITSIDGTVPELKAIARGDLDHVSVQPALGEGVMSMKLLWKMIQSGQQDLPAKAGRDDSTLEGHQLWRPVNVVSSDGFSGPWFRTQTYSVPEDVKPSDPRIWSNRVYKDQNGHLPDYAAP